MKLTKASISNFRGIENIEFELRDYVTLIGANNTGKSSSLKAIEMILNQERFSRDDWNNSNFQVPIVIECTFTDIQAWERSISGIAGIVQNNEIRLRVICEFDLEKNKPNSPIYEAFFEPEIIEGWGERWTEFSPELREILTTSNPGINATWMRSKSNQEIAKEYIRTNHPNLINRGVGQWSREGISIDAALKQAIPNAVLIPASSDFSSDMKSTSKTPFGQLIESIIMPAVRNTEEFNIFEEAVERLVRRIRGDGGNEVPELRDLVRTLSDRLSSIIMNMDVILSLNPPEINKIIGGGATIRIRDGVETTIEYQGHGTQRALIFALIETIARKNSVNSVAEGEEGQIEERQRPTIILFEEPELYLHPHLMRRLKKALVAISATDQWQVFSSTHSPFLIDVANDPKSLVILKKGEDRHVTKNQILIDIYQRELFSGERERLRALLDFHPTVSEAFFADNVILVEGDTEIAVFSLSNELINGFGASSSLLDSTTVVSCDGKWTIPGMAKILIKLGVNVKVIHDRDAKDKTLNELEVLSGFHEYCANAKILEVVGDQEKIFVVDDTFEHVLWNRTDAPSKDKPYNSWRKIKEILEAGRLEDYDQLKRIMYFAFDVRSS